MEKLTDHLIVISFDCLSSFDIDEIKQYPNFKRLLMNAAICKNVKTIYPSVTYACHASILTGRYPRSHRIVTNKLLQPHRSSPDWYWQSSYLKGSSILTAAREKGLTTAAFLWPVTAKEKINYHIPEIFANRPWHSQVAVSLMNGSFWFTLAMNRRFGHLRKGIQQPWLDDFVTAVAAYTIEKKKPNLCLIHLVDLDAQRHKFGVHSKEASAALCRHDRRLGELFQAIDRAGIQDHVTLVALGDHSSIDVQYVLHLNKMFQEKGWLQVGQHGNVVSWQVYCQSNDGSAYIHISQKENHHFQEEVYRQLLALKKADSFGIAAIYSGKEAEAMGADGQVAFMLEAKRGYYFSEATTGQIVEPVDQEKVDKGIHCHAVHGYEPRKEQYETVWIAKGRGIEPNQTIETMCLIDEGPTLARLLGIDLGEVDGQVIDQILKKT